MVPNISLQSAGWCLSVETKQLEKVKDTHKAVVHKVSYWTFHEIQDFKSYKTLAGFDSSY